MVELDLVLVGLVLKVGDLVFLVLQLLVFVFNPLLQGLNLDLVGVQRVEVVGQRRLEHSKLLLEVGLCLGLVRLKVIALLLQMGNRVLQ